MQVTNHFWVCKWNFSNICNNILLQGLSEVNPLFLVSRDRCRSCDARCIFIVITKSCSAFVLSQENLRISSGNHLGCTRSTSIDSLAWGELSFYVVLVHVLFETALHRQRSSKNHRFLRTTMAYKTTQIPPIPSVCISKWVSNLKARD